MKIRLNGKVYICNNAIEHIALFKQVSDELDKLKEKKEDNPILSKKSVVVGNDLSSKLLIDETRVEVAPTSRVQQKLVSTFPKNTYSISSLKHENDINAEYDMYVSMKKTERVTEPVINKLRKKHERKVTNYETYYEIKNERGSIPLTGYDIILKDEVKDFENSPLVFVNGAISHKIETSFYENAEILKGLPTAAFITGKATIPDKILKEAAKLIKLSKCVNTDIICYEANNVELRSSKDDKLFKAFDAMIGLTEILKGEGYIPLISLDIDIKKRLQKLEPNYKISVPIISRASSKELDNLSFNDDLLVMHSKNKYDELMLTDNTKYYIMNNQKRKTSSR